MRSLLLAALLTITNAVRAQNYIDYQRIFNRVDEDLFSDRLPMARQRLDTVYESYRFIFARHCMKALQIACTLEDPALVNRWLEKSFLQGIPLWVIRYDETARKCLSYAATRQTLCRYDSLRAIYKAAINEPLARQIDSLMKIDYQYTQKVNNGFWPFRHTIYGLRWIRNNKREFRALNRIIDTYGYPGERLIGLLNIEDSAQNAHFMKRAGVGLGLEERTALIMLIHYFSTPRKDINEKLYRNLLNGFCRPYYYAHINDFLAEHSRKYGWYERYYYHSAPPAGEPTNVANLRRHQIGLNTIEQQRRNMDQENEKWETHRTWIVLE